MTERIRTAPRPIWKAPMSCTKCWLYGSKRATASKKVCGATMAHRPKARKNTPAPTATALGGQAAVARRALGRIDDEVQRHLLCGASRDLGGVGASSLQTAGQGLEAGDEALHPNLVGQAVHDRWTA